MSIVNVNDGNFQSEVMNSSEPVLIDFYAPWCLSSELQSPIVDEKEKSYKVCRVDIGKSQALARQYRVKSVPTLIAMRDGTIVGENIGLTAKKDILNMLKK